MMLPARTLLLLPTFAWIAHSLPSTRSLLERQAIEPDGTTVPHPARLLAVVSYWHNETSPYIKYRLDAIGRTFAALDSWPMVSVTKMLVANAYVKEVENLHVKQVVRSEPVCNSTWKHNYCLPWEAMKVLRAASTGEDEPSCDLDKQAVCGKPMYDYYLYTEADIAIPARTFNFWRVHHEHLHDRGYSLVPYRLEPDQMHLSDCFDGYFQRCSKLAFPVNDVNGPAALYNLPRERVYIRLQNPYSAVLLLSKKLFARYIEGVEWDFSRQHSEWWDILRKPPGLPADPRESAMSGLLFAPETLHNGYITSPFMPVYHQLGMANIKDLVPNTKFLFTSLQAWCLKNSSCPKMWDLEYVEKYGTPDAKHKLIW